MSRRAGDLTDIEVVHETPAEPGVDANESDRSDFAAAGVVSRCQAFAGQVVETTAKKVSMSEEHPSRLGLWAKTQLAKVLIRIYQAKTTLANRHGSKPHGEEPTTARRRIQWSHAIAYGLLPGLAFLLASAAGYLKWQDGTLREAQAARTESVQAGAVGTVALLSYRPETVENDLDAAKSRLTGTFLTAYTSLIHDVVIPGAKQKQISAVATVAAAASTSATANHSVVLLFVNQTVIVGQSAPTNTSSSVRVSLDKVDGRWLISQFDPV
jgi:Mce-associated membrane protein